MVNGKWFEHSDVDKTVKAIIENGSRNGWDRGKVVLDLVEGQ